MVVFNKPTPIEAAALQISALMGSVKGTRKLPFEEAPLRIAFFGMQSAGKTAGLCCLAGHRLGPSKSGTGTRCPTVYIMTTASDEKEQRCSIEWRANNRNDIDDASLVFEHVDAITQELERNNEFSSDPITVRISLTTCVDMTVIDLPGLRGVNASGAAADNKKITEMWHKVLTEAPTLPIVLLTVHKEETHRESDIVTVRQAMGSSNDTRNALVFVTHLDDILGWLTEKDFEEIPILIGLTFGCSPERVRFLSWMPEMYELGMKEAVIKAKKESKGPAEWNKFFANVVEIDEEMRREHLATRCGWLATRDIGISAAMNLVKKTIVDDICEKLPRLLAIVTTAQEDSLTTAATLTASPNAASVRQRMKDFAKLFSGLVGSWSRWTGADLFYPTLECLKKKYPEIHTAQVGIESIPGLVHTFDGEVTRYDMERSSLVRKFRDIPLTKGLAEEIATELELVSNSSLKRLTKVFELVCVRTLPDPASLAELKRLAGMGNMEHVHNGSVLETIISKSIGKQQGQIQQYVEEMILWVTRSLLSQIDLAFDLLRDVAPILEAMPGILAQLESILRDIYTVAVTEKMGMITEDMLKKLSIAFGGLDLDDFLAPIRVISCATLPTELLLHGEIFDSSADAFDLIKMKIGIDKSGKQLAVNFFKMIAESRGESESDRAICDLIAHEGLKLVPVPDTELGSRGGSINKLIASIVFWQHAAVAHDMKKQLKVQVADMQQQINHGLYERIIDAALSKEVIDDDAIVRNLRHPSDEHCQRVEMCIDELEKFGRIRGKLIEMGELLSGKTGRSQANMDEMSRRSGEALAALSVEFARFAGEHSASSAPSSPSPTAPPGTLHNIYTENAKNEKSDDPQVLRERIKALEMQCALHRSDKQAQQKILDTFTLRKVDKAAATSAKEEEGKVASPPASSSQSSKSTHSTEGDRRKEQVRECIDAAKYGSFIGDNMIRSALQLRVPANVTVVPASAVNNPEVLDGADLRNICVVPIQINGNHWVGGVIRDKHLTILDSMPFPTSKKERSELVESKRAFHAWDPDWEYRRAAAALTGSSIYTLKLPKFVQYVRINTCAVDCVNNILSELKCESTFTRGSLVQLCADHWGFGAEFRAQMERSK